MVGLLLNYSADPSVVDLTRLNETMVKVLNRELTTFDPSDNENDDASLSPSSPITSADDSEHDEEKIDKNLLESSSTYIPKIQQKKVSRKASVSIDSHLFLISLSIIFMNIHQIHF